MVIAICIIVWILCDIAEDSARDRSYYNKQEERRHQELLESEKRRREESAKRQKELEKQWERKPKMRTIVREIIDEQGRVIRETITEEI